jgi:hypothetical protein
MNRRLSRQPDYCEDVGALMFIAVCLVFFAWAVRVLWSASVMLFW